MENYIVKYDTLGGAKRVIILAIDKKDAKAIAKARGLHVLTINKEI